MTGFYFSGWDGVSMKSLLYRTLKELPHFISPTSVEEVDEEERGRLFSFSPAEKRRISAARFIKEQSLQRGHKLSSEVFTIITITSHPSPPHSLFLFCCRLIPPLFTSEPVILRPFLSCLFSLLADLSSFTAAPHCCDIGQIFFCCFYHLC